MEKTVTQEKGDVQFHDNESGDIYDLYNACNGALHNGRLDIRKLDELSPDEAEFLDIPWLKEVWEHAASGCAHCENVITTLNVAREAKVSDPKETDREVAQAGSGSLGDSFFKRIM